MSLISFLPKSFFHDALAGHRDGVSCTHNEKQTPCVHIQGYNCSFTDLVVTAPYEPATTVFDLLKPALQASLNARFCTQLFFISCRAAESRGPPAFPA